MNSLFDCAENDRSKWIQRLEKNNYKEGRPIIDRFIGEYRWLSNFHFTEYPEKSTEHYYQAAKTINNEEGRNWKKTILAAKTPSEAKRIAMKVPLREDWEEIKYSVMQFALAKKFLGSFELYRKLIGTDGFYLIESNTWHDNYYGICIKKDCEKCSHKKGYNNLGNALMELRDLLIMDMKKYSSNAEQEAVALKKGLEELEFTFKEVLETWE